MAIVKPVLGVTLGLQSTALLGESLKLVSKKTMWGGSKNRVAKPKKIVKGFTNIMIGTALLKPTSTMVSNL